MLTLAIPSKGRLKEKCDEMFVAAGLEMTQTNARGYRAVFSGMADIEIMLLSASEIAS
ncbi:MAG: ATP phosphoribosyltransferase, partial [Lysobacteraceae bacterium]